MFLALHQLARSPHFRVPAHLPHPSPCAHRTCSGPTRPAPTPTTMLKIQHGRWWLSSWRAGRGSPQWRPCEARVAYLACIARQLAGSCTAEPTQRGTFNNFRPAAHLHAGMPHPMWPARTPSPRPAPGTSATTATSWMRSSRSGWRLRTLTLPEGCMVVDLVVTAESLRSAS